jgi:hypothetical protein
MIPKTYEIEIDETQNEGADQFKLSKQNMYVKAGKGDQFSSVMLNGRSGSLGQYSMP